MASFSAFVSRAASRWPSREKLSETSKGTKQQRPEEPKLTQAELDEEIGRKLESVNFLAPKSAVRFNYVNGEYEPAPAPSPVLRLFSLKSGAILKSAADNLQLDDILDFSEIGEGLEDGGETKAAQSGFLAGRTRRERKVQNAFNFCDEASQTDETLFRFSATQTEAPVIQETCLSVFPSEIYDTYAEDLKKKKERAKEGKPTPVIHQPSEEESTEKKESLIYMERAVSQNIFDLVNYDFRYYEDPADEFRTDGSLLPLWRFFLPGQNIPVTGVEWSKAFPDIVAVAFGDFEFSETEKTGAVGIFSIKCPLYPEYLRSTQSSVLCVSLHPKFLSLLVIGQLDGHVAVFDSASSKDGPQFISDSESKHLNGVFSIMWGQDDELSFFSNSADGIVKIWHMSKAFMDATVVRTIVYPVNMTLEGVHPKVLGCGFRFEFHPTDQNVYLIGTSEGFILKCSMLLNTSSIFVYNAHRLPVHCIAFNPFLPNIFLSCSSDWTVKVWQDERSDPLLVFDLNCEVMDGEWAPFSSTVFSALTANGFVHIFDLHVNRHRAIYKQHAVSSLDDNKPTRQAFNPDHPILVVGDKLGRLTALKLSPNLRVPAKASKKDAVDQRTLEIRKLEKILSFMKPKSLNLPEDTPSLEL